MATIQSTLSAMPSTNSNDASAMEYFHRQDRVPIAHSSSQLDNLNWKKFEKDQEYRKTEMAVITIQSYHPAMPQLNPTSHPPVLRSRVLGTHIPRLILVYS